jgi:hypothetical protein
VLIKKIEELINKLKKKEDERRKCALSQTRANVGIMDVSMID